MTAEPSCPGDERPGTGGRPVVVVPHGTGSVPLLQVAAAARPIADVVWLVDSSDPAVGASLRMLRRFGSVVDAAGLHPDQVAAAVAPYRPSGVLPLLDRDLVPLADLAVRLGLPFHSPVVATRLSDKLVQRRALAEGGVPVPGSWEVPGTSVPEALARLSGQVGFPAVLKPRAGAGSRRTVPVADLAGLAAALAALAGRGVLPEPMLVEEYLPGRAGDGRRPFAEFVSVETVVERGGIHHLSVTGRLPLVEPFRETGSFVPSALGAEDTEAVLGAATDALEALGVAHGCCHTEVKLTPDGPRIIEVNGRMGGGVPDMLRVATGLDLIGLCVRLAVGEPARLERPLRFDGVGYWLFLQPPATARTVRSIGGMRAVAELPGVEDVFPHLRPGDLVDPWRGTDTFVMAVLGKAADHAGVRRANELAHEAADVVYDRSDDPIGDGAAKGAAA